MPALIQNAIAISAALIFFANSLFINNQQVFISHTETENYIVFQVANPKTKTNPTVVSINKNNGKVKIDFKDKRQQIEFNIEYDNTISPENREKIDEIVTNIAEYTKKNKSVKGKVKHWVKDFVNRKL